MLKARKFIKVYGIVQGVGFRPFVYNLALSLNLYGWVNNNSEGVFIDIEGEKKNIETFLSSLQVNPPPLARIEEISVSPCQIYGYKDFSIKESEKNNESRTLISPDISLCRDCREDILNPNNRRFAYPFTNCTNCGPRFSIIKSLPYDRDKTTMKKFGMCPSCYSEYITPSNRRFHAQPNACSKCGPNILLTDKHGNKLKDNYTNLQTFKYVAKKLKEGKIFAIKGLTGFHLSCNAKDEKVINILRERKKRPHKPFAVMMKDIDTVKKYCKVSSKEEQLLTSIRRPIVLLEQNEDLRLPKAISGSQSTLGVMLPYTPLHELIFNEDIEVLVMTSANYSSLPLEYDNTSVLTNVSTLVDYILMHNRDILIPVDDSIVKVAAEKERIIRRARGYVPDPLVYKNIYPILALGPNMKNTFAIGKENFIFLSQHNGDLENIETIENYKNNIAHFSSIFSFTPSYIACDMHPDYSSTKYAEEFTIKKIHIQHHHAHIASCMVENNLYKKVIGVSFDGTGFGEDSKIWGGEFLFCDLKHYERVGHLDYTSLPGGDKAIKEPWRIAVSFINKAFLEESESSKLNLGLYEIIEQLYGKSALPLLKLLKTKTNCIDTSSMGRLFDAVSSILGFCSTVTYEGQASIELEAEISHTTSEYYPYDIKLLDNILVVIPNKIILAILKDKIEGLEPNIMSAKFHNTVVKLTVEMCSKLRVISGVNDIALSGGVFQNTYLLEALIKALSLEAFEVYSQSSIPTNDGGIALGQIAIANERIKDESTT